MRVIYREVGGFAGLRRGVELDTDALSPREARKLERLVAAAALEARDVHAPPEARDLVVYEIRIETRATLIVSRFDDMTAPESAAELVEFLRSRAKALAP